MERARGAPPAVGLSALPDELLARVLVHLPSTHDYGRADGVCHAWHARGSPVEQALRERIEALDGAEPTALPGTGSLTQRMCWSELLRAARKGSGVVAAGPSASAVIDACGRPYAWGEFKAWDEQVAFRSADGPDWLTAHENPCTCVERVSIGDCHMLMLTDTGEVLSFGVGSDWQLSAAFVEIAELTREVVRERDARADGLRGSERRRRGRRRRGWHRGVWGRRRR